MEENKEKYEKKELQPGEKYYSVIADLGVLGKHTFSLFANPDYVKGKNLPFAKSRYAVLFINEKRER